MGESSREDLMAQGLARIDTREETRGGRGRRRAPLSRRPMGPSANGPGTADLGALTPEELIARSRAAADGGAPYLEELFGRVHPQVAAWCLRLCGDVDLAADLAQEAMVRVHQRLDSFRMESRFSTWLYTVTRNVAINQLQSAQRKSSDWLDDRLIDRLSDPSPDAEQSAIEAQIGRQLQRAMRRDLEPLEAKVLYLHYVHGLTLPAITGLLGLTNRSGAKAPIVSAKRKLKKTFGRWLASQTRTPGES